VAIWHESHFQVAKDDKMSPHETRYPWGVSFKTPKISIFRPSKCWKLTT